MSDELQRTAELFLATSGQIGGDVRTLAIKIDEFHSDVNAAADAMEAVKTSTTQLVERVARLEVIWDRGVRLVKIGVIVFTVASALFAAGLGLIGYTAVNNRKTLQIVESVVTPGKPRYEQMRAEQIRGFAELDCRNRRIANGLPAVADGETCLPAAPKP